jgi:hypothetical protein
MSCAADLLNESLRVLEEALDGPNHTSDGSTPPPTTR